MKAQGIWFSTTDPGRVLVGLNQRQKSVFDVYSIDLKSSQVTLDTVNPGNVTSWVVTARLKVGVSISKTALRLFVGFVGFVGYAKVPPTCTKPQTHVAVDCRLAC